MGGENQRKKHMDYGWRKSKDQIMIHPTANVSELADLEPSKKGTEIWIGAGSCVDSFVKIKPAGGKGDVIIGERCYLNASTLR